MSASRFRSPAAAAAASVAAARLSTRTDAPATSSLEQVLREGGDAGLGDGAEHEVEEDHEARGHELAVLAVGYAAELERLHLETRTEGLKSLAVLQRSPLRSRSIMEADSRYPAKGWWGFSYGAQGRPKHNAGKSVHMPTTTYSGHCMLLHTGGSRRHRCLSPMRGSLAGFPSFLFTFQVTLYIIYTFIYK